MNHKLIGIGGLWQPESNPSCGRLRGRQAANNGDRRSGGEGEGQRDASGDATVTQRCVPSAPSGMAAKGLGEWVYTKCLCDFIWIKGAIAHFYRHVAQCSLPRRLLQLITAHSVANKNRYIPSK